MNDDIEKKKAEDSGLALVLIFLLVHHFSGIKGWFPDTSHRFISCAIILLVLVMIFPYIFRPFAKLWFGLATAMGSIASRILLTLIFFFLVTPVGFFRRIAGDDPMRLKEWKKGSNSVFKEKNTIYTRDDLGKSF